MRPILRYVAIQASWLDENERRTVDRDSVAETIAEAAASAAEPVLVVLQASDGASLHIVAGDASGTVLIYFPPGYEHAAVGSLHSVGDADAAVRDDWQPPLTASYFGHHTEFPRWSVVAHEVGNRAARQFCERPVEPPPAVSWEPD